MGFQFACARAISAISTWGLKHVFHRPAANFPGKVALYVDPAVIAHLAPKLAKGSVCVVGTNGKTTVTNLLADALEMAGQQVVCNRTGANLDSGVATALLHAKPSDWGVFESDELWLAKILPHLQADYVVLLNLFRDQLDRVGEIDRVQDSIVGALESSPNTVLVYNVDDPLCAAVSDRVSNRSLGFGVEEDLGLPQNTVTDAQMCQRCSTMLTYDYRLYGQLGDYRCPSCGFKRPDPDYGIKEVRLDADGLSFALQGPEAVTAARVGDERIEASFTGAYMVYNLAAVGVAARLMGCPDEAVQKAIGSFAPDNGRLQSYEIDGRPALLNLAKNPTGFNQNIKIILQNAGPKAVAFFVNDREADGRDVSWLWDIDFEELAGEPSLVVFAGGTRKNDVQVRLKYAGLDARLVEGAADVFASLAELPSDAGVYLIANYTVLPAVQADLDRLVRDGGGAVDEPDVLEGLASGHVAAKFEGSTQHNEVPCVTQAASVPTSVSSGLGGHDRARSVSGDESPLIIAHLFPDLLNLYGDGGNVRVLETRLRDRGIPVEVKQVRYGESVDLREVDLVFLGGGPDREQRLASTELMRMRDDLHAFVEDDGVLLAICGGYQILGHEWLLADETVKGLDIIDVTTRRAPSSANRLIDNIILSSPRSPIPVVGYENHAGRTYLGDGSEPFGKVISTVGQGNNETDRADGVLYRNVVGTYLHGPLLSKNPALADDLLDRALARRERRAGVAHPGLSPLDDSAELAANEHMRGRLSIR